MSLPFNSFSTLTRYAIDWLERYSPDALLKFDKFLERGLRSDRAVSPLLKSVLEKSVANSVSEKIENSVENRLETGKKSSKSVVSIYSQARPAAFKVFTANQNANQNDSEDPFNSEALKWTRSDGKADGRGATVVTYAFTKDFRVGDLSADRAKELFKRALSAWAEHAPIDFVEISDPGSGDKVDIYVQSREIDGPKKTLAEAFGPTIGDITFDETDDWTDLKFLETSTHELGHSLGLDHEDDVEAIMNSRFNRRFETDDRAFLLEDDIKGIQFLYGSGKGSVTTLKDNVSELSEPVAAAATNLVTNGSFEETSTEVGGYKAFRRIKGWSTVVGTGFLVDRRPDTWGPAADGSAWVKLDLLGKNNAIAQNVDTVTGQPYLLSVDYTSGGQSPDSTAVEVFWDGNKIDTLTGGGKGQWKTYTYTVTGGDREVSTVAFRSAGEIDDDGGFIDRVSVFEGSSLAALIEPEDYRLGSTAQTAGITHGSAMTGTSASACCCSACSGASWRERTMGSGSSVGVGLSDRLV